MKRCLFLSAIFHGALLLLLFSWEVPLADRLLPQNILQVSLVEKIEEKKPQRDKPTPAPKGVEKRDVGVTRRPVPANQEEKKEEPPGQETIKTTQPETKKERPKMEEKVPAEDGVFRAKPEEPPSIQAKLPPQSTEGGNTKDLAYPAGGLQISEGKADSGATFLASPGLEMEKEGIPGGRGGKGFGSGRGEEGSPRLSSKSTSSQDGDIILFEIIRRIEGAKRYPRMARRMGLEGKTAIRFKLQPNGKVESAEIVESSGSDILDQASLETVQRAAPLPYKEGWLKVVIVFKIL